MASIIAKPIPTGGASSLTIKDVSGAMILARAVSGASGVGTFTPIYSGVATPAYIDVGDGMNAPLDPSTIYVYSITDLHGSSISNGVRPTSTLNPEIEPLTEMLIRLLQGAFNSSTPPSGMPALQVLQAMPLGGLPPMPFLTVNLDLIQQEEIPIGQGFPKTAEDGSQVITEQALYTWRISVLASSSGVRDYYRSVVTAVLKSIIFSVLMPIGLNVEDRYQITSGQVADANAGMDPGFYYAEALLTIKGTLNISITPDDLGIIEKIIFTGFNDGRPVVSVTVPVSGA